MSSSSPVMPNFSKSGVNVIRVKSLSLPLASTIFGLFTLLMLFSNTCLYLRPLALGTTGWPDSKSAPRAGRFELSSQALRCHVRKVEHKTRTSNGKYSAGYSHSHMSQVSTTNLVLKMLHSLAPYPLRPPVTFFCPSS